MGARTFQDLDIWKRSMSLAEIVYKLTESFPRSEMFGLAGQMRRSALSVPSNIAEGFSRSGGLEFRQFLCIARGSLAELATQCMLAHRVGYVHKERADEIVDEAEQIGRMTTTLIQRIRESSATSG